MDEPQEYLSDQEWVNHFGVVLQKQVEDYGRLTSLRIWYEDGLEVEFGLTDTGWAGQPLDEGTDRVLMDSLKILCENSPLLSPVLEGFSEARELYTSMAQAIHQCADPNIAARNRQWFKNDDFQSYGLTFASHKEISLLYRKAIQRLPLRGRLHLARLLALSEMAEEINFANAILARSATELGPANFAYLDEHLNHFHGWAHVDDFSINVLQPILWEYPAKTLALLRDWNRSGSMWKRRASVVGFVRKVGSSGKFTTEALDLCENLLWDKEDLVQKGVGWALKDVMRGDREQVLGYIKMLRRRGVPATITLYSIRDLKGAERREILDIQPGSPAGTG